MVGITAWDLRFMEIADLVGTWSKDPSSKIGACCVRNRTIIATGYNGLPHKVKDHAELLRSRAVRTMQMVHAEANTIASAAREGTQLSDTHLYVTHPPCAKCAGLIINVGISRVVYRESSVEFAERWADETRNALSMLVEAGVKVLHVSSQCSTDISE